MSGHDTARAPHLRSSPSPSTPGSTSRLLFSIANSLTYPYILIVGLPTFLSTAFSHLYTSPHPADPSGWSLLHALSIQWAKIRNGPSSYILPPVPTLEEETVLPPIQWNTLPAEDRTKVEIKTVSVDPLPAEYQQRGITVCPGVESVVRPGYWLTPPGSAGRGDEKAKKGEKVVLHLHGGGHIRGHPLWIDSPHGFALSLGQRVFSMNYRKCLSDDTAFPAPLLDAVAGYLYLTQHLSFQPSSITLIGESAGAHLALILSRHLPTLSLPLPGHMVLVSPWADFTMDPSSLHGSYANYSRYDFLIPSRLHLGIRSSTRHYTPEAIRGPYFSPALAGEREWAYLQKEGVRVMVVYGTRELFEDEDKAVVAGMTDDGVDVVTHLDVDGFHTRVSILPEPSRDFKKALSTWLSKA